MGIKENFNDLLIRTPADLIENAKRIESLIRCSKEYKAYLAYLHEQYEMNSCEHFREKNFDRVTLEFHHHILTLYDLVMIVGGKYLVEHLDDEVYVFDIAREVIRVHLKDQVAGIMLSKTIHELYHSGQYEIAKDASGLNLGNYREFLKEYREYMTPAEIERYQLHGACIDGESNEQRKNSRSAKD